jgi:hypothetical protein
METQHDVEPVLPDPPVEAIEEEEPPPRRGRRRRKVEEPPPQPPADDVDAWLLAMDPDWDSPGMICKLERRGPKTYRGIGPLDGYLESRENAPILMDEVREKYGGGTYRVQVTGPRNQREVNEGIALSRGYKEFSISVAAYPPKTNANALPVDPKTGMYSGAGGYGSDDDDALQRMSAPAQKSLVDVVGRVVDHGLRGNRESGSSDRAYESSVAAIERSANERVNAAVQAAADRVRAYEERLAEERREREKAMDNAEKQRAEFESRLHNLQGGNMEVLSTILPALTQSSSQQSEMALRSADARVAAAHEAAREEIKAAHRHHEMQVENLKQMHQMQNETLKAASEREIGRLEQQSGLHLQRIQHLEQENQKLRDEVLKLVQGTDPMSSLDRTAQLFGLMNEMKSTFSTGGGEGESGAQLSEDAPDFLKVLNNFGPALSNLTAPIAARFAGGAGGAMDPQQAAMLQQQQLMLQQGQPDAAAAAAMMQPPPQPPPQAVMPDPPAAPPAPPAPPTQGTRLSKADVLQGLALLNSAVAAQTPIAQAVTLARSNMNHAMLRALVSREPNAVVAEFEQKGVLAEVGGAVATDPGKQYLVQFLTTLGQVGTI